MYSCIHVFGKNFSCLVLLVFKIDTCILHVLCNFHTDLKIRLLPKSPKVQEPENNKTFYQHLSFINMLLLVKNTLSNIIGCVVNKSGRKSGAIIF